MAFDAAPDERARVEADLDDPQQAIARCLEEEERVLRMLVDMAAVPGTSDPALTDAVHQAKLTLLQLPRIRKELLGLS